MHSSNPPSFSRRFMYIGLPIAVIASSAMIARAFDTSWIAPGQTLSSEKLKADLDEAQARLAVLEQKASAFHASLTVATSPQIANAIVFDQVDFDLASEYNHVTGAFTPKNAGVYLITCSVTFTSGGTVNTWAMVVRKNGAQIAGTSLQSSTSTNDNGALAPLVTATIQLAAGDTVTCGAGIFPPPATPPALDVLLPSDNTFSAARLY